MERDQTIGRLLRAMHSGALHHWSFPWRTKPPDRASPRSPAFLRLHVVLPLAAGGAQLLHDQPPSGRNEQPHSRVAHLWRHLWSVALAQSSTHSPHLVWRNGNVLAFRARAQHSSARILSG